MTIGLALFYDELDEKRNVVANLQSLEGSAEPQPRICIEQADLQNETVASFISKNNKKFLDLLGIGKGFLDVDPVLYGTNSMYQAGASQDSPFVTNDVADNGVALVQDFTKIPRTKSKDQL